jgi:hypothetical protein
MSGLPNSQSAIGSSILTNELSKIHSELSEEIARRRAHRTIARESDYALSLWGCWRSMIALIGAVADAAKEDVYQLVGKRFVIEPR